MNGQVQITWYKYKITYMGEVKLKIPVHNR